MKETVVKPNKLKLLSSIQERAEALIDKDVRRKGEHEEIDVATRPFEMLDVDGLEKNLKKYDGRSILGIGIQRPEAQNDSEKLNGSPKSLVGTETQELDQNEDDTSYRLLLTQITKYSKGIYKAVRLIVEFGPKLSIYQLYFDSPSIDDGKLSLGESEEKPLMLKDLGYWNELIDHAELYKAVRR